MVFIGEREGSRAHLSLASQKGPLTERERHRATSDSGRLFHAAASFRPVFLAVCLGEHGSGETSVWQ